jgi:hypothetical protein
VRAAFLAAAERVRADRRRAAERACRESALRDTEERFSRFRAPLVARDRVREGFLRRARARLMSRLACFRVRADAFPRFGGGSFTPARRAFDKPMAIACWGERAPCSPSLMCSISSRTNSPAWVEGDLPSRSSSRARSIGSSSGIQSSFAGKCLIGRNENQLVRSTSTEESSGPC